jgi:hypothetical protein
MYPHWYPAGLFEITRHELPPDWYFERLREEDGFEVNAIWGYEELVNMPEHFDDLPDRKKSAIDVFVERKKQIDEVS